MGRGGGKGWGGENLGVADLALEDGAAHFEVFISWVCHVGVVCVDDVGQEEERIRRG